MHSNQPIPETYPAIHVENKDPAYIPEILSNMGGVDSEMSAVSLYVYNQLVTENLPDLASAFQRISIDEMRHLKIFGTIALQLGADPRLWIKRGHTPVYWSAKYNRYTTKPRQILSNALYTEYMTVDKYTRQAKRIQDASIVENLQRIILEEQQHIATFKALIQTLA